MRKLARVTVTMRELDRLKVIEAVVEGNSTPMRAAERLGLTTPGPPVGEPVSS